jgi:transcriptional regulator with XRE-family HTH domain
MVGKMLVRKIVKTEKEIAGLGARLRDAQKKSGRTVRDLAEGLDVTPNYWHLLVGEKTVLTWDLLQKIEKELSVDFGVDL